MPSFMSNNISQDNSVLNKIPIYVLGFIVVGLFMGGIYSLPAMRMTKSTDPWLTMFLGAGLTITIITVGLLFFTSYLHILYAIVFANTLLIIRRLFGKLDHSVERFGLIHAFCLVGSFSYAILLTK
jgi:hypothetical protein